MAKKQNRVQVILECTESRNAGVRGISRYHTVKNKKNTTERIEIMKYNKFLKKHTLHKEVK
jgi:large subunit ribosomal protein L33